MFIQRHILIRSMAIILLYFLVFYFLHQQISPIEILTEQNKNYCSCTDNTNHHNDNNCSSNKRAMLDHNTTIDIHLYYRTYVHMLLYYMLMVENCNKIPQNWNIKARTQR